jgi:hypothetical protein
MIKTDPWEEQISVLREILRWVRFSAASQVGEVLLKTLDSHEKIRIYDLSDGINTTRSISEKTGLHFTTIASLWRQWTMMGLGESVSTTGGSRFKKSFDVRIFGVPITTVPKHQNINTQQEFSREVGAKSE